MMKVAMSGANDNSSLVVNDGDNIVMIEEFKMVNGKLAIDDDDGIFMR